ncbi:hypothetical protein [Actinomadura craniellae]|uniref:hypothetical protein n=1 Tax=Actinomadura craniellae TaxID=2231787 RepID=UPI0018F19D7A|nr:hypothetical protein [Actinomadura craniellae]
MNDISRPRLGVDFGRVIHGASLDLGGQADTAFLQGTLEEALASPATEGVYEVLPALVERFGGQVWIISKCGERVEQRTRRWLDHHDFYARTGIPVGNLRFCRRRADKAIHCADLGITHMIDDRLGVHQALRDLVPHLYLFGWQEQPPPTWVRHTENWAEVAEAVTADLPPAGSPAPETARAGARAARPRPARHRSR